MGPFMCRADESLPTYSLVERIRGRRSIRLARPISDPIGFVGLPIKKGKRGAIYPLVRGIRMAAVADGLIRVGDFVEASARGRVRSQKVPDQQKVSTIGVALTQASDKGTMVWVMVL